MLKEKKKNEIKKENNKNRNIKTKDNNGNTISYSKKIRIIYLIMLIIFP